MAAVTWAGRHQPKRQEVNFLPVERFMRFKLEKFPSCQHCLGVKKSEKSDSICEEEVLWKVKVIFL